MAFLKSRQSTFHAKVQEELICAVCLDFLSEPKVLSCAHSFCLACLNKIVTLKRKFEEHSSLDLECPSCRQVTTLNAGRVDELNTNYNLKRLVDIVSEEEKKKARDVIKRRVSIRPSVQQTPQFNSLQCKKHKKQLEYFCVECNTLICPKCISDDHYLHKFEDVDEVLPKHISGLRSLIQPACEVATHAEQSMKDLIKVKNDITKNASDTIADVEATFKKISQSLACRKKAIVSTIRMYSDVKLSRLDAHHEMLRTHHDIILEDVSKLEKLIEGDENFNIICQKRPISEQIAMHEQSIISLIDMLKNRRVTSFLSFNVSPTITCELDDLGELEEHSREPEKSFHSVRRVVISEEEDPYNNVPLRFEDTSSDALQTEVRIDESKTHIRYEPQSNLSKLEGQLEKSLPPLPPKRRISAPPIAPKPKAEQLSKIPILPPKPHYLKTEKKKSSTLPQFRSTALISQGDTHSDEEYEELDYCPPSRDTPPPIPPNHPDKPRVFPKPSKRGNSDTCVVLTSSFEPQSMSHTLPSRIASKVYTSEVIKPVEVINSIQLSSPLSNDIVYPNGVCYSTGMNTLIVTDVYNHCIRLIDTNKRLIEKIGKAGRCGGQFKEPSGVTVDINGDILVCERDNQRIQRFSSNGKYINKFGQKTLVSNLLSDPIGIAISANGNIAVSDWDKGQVIFFTSTGKHIKSLDICQGFLKFPAGITFTSNGNLLVVDRGNHCIWNINEHGEVENKISAYGNYPGQLNYPYGITIGLDESIIVTECGSCRVSIFSKTGQFIRSFGTLGSEPGMFNLPRHVCVNDKGYIIVADEMNKRIQVFNI